MPYTRDSGRCCVEQANCVPLGFRPCVIKRSSSETQRAGLEARIFKARNPGLKYYSRKRKNVATLTATESLAKIIEKTKRNVRFLFFGSRSELGEENMNHGLECAFK